MIALGTELLRRGHQVVFPTMEIYRERIEMVGFEFRPMRPHLDVNDRELAELVMDSKKGPEKLIKEIVFPQLHGIYQDLTGAVEGADLFLTGEIVYVARSVAEKTGVKWMSQSLSPISLFSHYDPSIYPAAEILEYLRFMPPIFHRQLFKFLRWTISDWFAPYKEFRRDLGLDEDHDPVFSGKYSSLRHLVMFSRALAEPQPDWPRLAVQTGFCFYDGQGDLGKMPDGLAEFLAADEPPVVFTLGSAAVMAPGEFFSESVKAAKILKKRAVLLYGIFNEPPQGLTEDIVGFDYAPYSGVFPKAACIVHQGGVGTTSQVLRAGVPMLVMPYGHDQPDNAARCRRRGVARVINRYRYTAESAAREIRQILAEPSYRARALEAKDIIDAENGTQKACDEIETALKN
jgi:rhamnosyltransferase subunit B